MHTFNYVYTNLFWSCLFTQIFKCVIMMMSWIMIKISDMNQLILIIFCFFFQVVMLNMKGLAEFFKSHIDHKFYEF